MPLATPRFLYFDLGNVLLNFDHDIACRNLAALLGTTWEQIRSIVFETDLQWRYERGDISTDELADELFRQAGHHAPLAEMRRACAEIFEVNLPVVPIAGQLRAAGYRLGILSNTCDAHWQHVFSRYRMLSEWFDVFALSYEIRSMKPEPQIYAAAARLAGCAAGELFFVDDRADNVAGARTAGLDAVQFTSARQLADDLRERGLRFNY